MMTEQQEAHSHAMRWLSCHEIGLGIFSDERVVTIKVRGTGRQEFLVPKTVVCEQRQALRVKTYQYDNGLWALIPEAQPQTIPINDGELLA